MRGGGEREEGAIVLVLFSPWCHPATVVTSKFSWTAEEDSAETKEEGRQAEKGGGEEHKRKTEDREWRMERDGVRKRG